MILNLITYLMSGEQQLVLIALVMLLVRVPVLFLALSIHECAHGWVANKLGDPTAKSLGRLTLNPIKHLDPIGTISMLVLGIGWAKPVPINTRYFKKPKRDMALTAAAGPLSNLLCGFAYTLLLFLSFRFLYAGFHAGPETAKIYANETLLFNAALNYLLEEGVGKKLIAILWLFLLTGATLNFSLAIFNLIPIPPFDGSRLAFAFLPDKIYFGVMKYERIIMFVFLALFYFGSGLLSNVLFFLIDLFFQAFFWVFLL